MRLNFPGPDAFFFAYVLLLPLPSVDSGGSQQTYSLRNGEKTSLIQCVCALYKGRSGNLCTTVFQVQPQCSILEGVLVHTYADQQKNIQRNSKEGTNSFQQAHNFATIISLTGVIY